MSDSPSPLVPQTEPGRRDTELAIAAFRTIFIVVVLFSPQFGEARGTSGRMLVMAVIAAACYNLLLFLVHIAGLNFPRGAIVAGDVVLISLWIYFCGPECRLFFGLYYAVVIVSALWFGVGGAFAAAGASCGLYACALWAGSGEGWAAAASSSSVLQMVFLVVAAGVVSVMAELQKRERRALEQSHATLQQFRQRIQIARRIDDLVRPKHLATVAGLDIAFRYRPAAAPHDAGGDYYDVIRLGERRAGVCVGDIRATLEYATPYIPVFKSEFRATARREFAPAKVLAEMNRYVAERIEERRDFEAFISICYLVFDLDAGLLTYAIAGNEPPVVIPASGEPPISLERAGIVLGVVPDATYEQGVVPLHSNDVVVLFTDGLTEAADASGQFLERRGLLAAVSSHVGLASAGAIAERVFGAVTEYGKEGRRRDDMTLLVVRVTASDVGRSQAEAQAHVIPVD